MEERAEETREEEEEDQEATEGEEKREGSLMGPYLLLDFLTNMLEKPYIMAHPIRQTIQSMLTYGRTMSIQALTAFPLTVDNLVSYVEEKVLQILNSQ